MTSLESKEADIEIHRAIEALRMVIRTAVERRHIHEVLKMLPVVKREADEKFQELR